MQESFDRPEGFTRYNKPVLRDILKSNKQEFVKLCMAIGHQGNEYLLKCPIRKIVRTVRLLNMLLSREGLCR